MRGGQREFLDTEHELSTTAENETKTSMKVNYKTAAVCLSADVKGKGPQLSISEALEKEFVKPETGKELIEESGNLYCPECFLPLHPDPKPENLYIFLHALKYTTSLGEFKTEMPEWAAKGWKWDQS